MKDTKCHRFWINNLNPITMKKDDNELSASNLSNETLVRRANGRKQVKFNHENQ
jgi:hypothetical protein|tara:strand:- start:2276 stop:2437 length:162 start_codon:yes stop_codon:yes gene_type:complete